MVNDLLKVRRVGRTTLIVRNNELSTGRSEETLKTQSLSPTGSSDSLPQKLKELRQDLTGILTMLHNLKELNILSRSSDRRLKLVVITDACVSLVTKCTALTEYPVHFEKDFMLALVNTPYRHGERRNLIMQGIDQLRNVLLLTFFTLSQQFNRIDPQGMSPSKSGKRNQEILAGVFKLSLDLDRELEGLKRLDGKF